ncbi:MAG TPA: hypothetical protein VF559_09730 [Caulobacteraceae bacterium]|jgi:hypothetical protein
MFQTLDVLIGLAVVMLGVSTAVTMLTQLVVAALNLRSASLHHGIADLLILTDRGVNRTDALQIADHILRDPLIAGPPLLGTGKPRRAPVVLREELIKLLLHFGADPVKFPEPLRVPGMSQTTLDALRAKLRTSLGQNGLPEPGETLRSIRMHMLELERSSPELSNSARVNTAILAFAESDFVGKINGWFDQSMDRVTDIFTGRARLVTLLSALLVAVVVQLDAVGLVNRLYTDDDYRQQLVGWALEHPKAVEAAEQAEDRKAGSPGAAEGGAATAAAAAGEGVGMRLIRTAARAAEPRTALAEADAALASSDLAAEAISPKETPGEAAGPAAAADAGSQAGAALDGAAPAAPSEPATPQPDDTRSLALGKAALQQLRAGELITIPDSFGTWFRNAEKVNWPGVLLTALMLSLGAPFWYEVLKNLVKLRSVLGRKDDAERRERQTNQTLPPAASGLTARTAAAEAAPSAANPLSGGEQGDLSAVG